MSSQEKIIAFVRSIFAHLPNVKEKKMFGKIAFIVKDKLCITVGKKEIRCRIDPGLQSASKLKFAFEPVIMKGREMKGYVRIKNQDLQSEKEIQFWISLCLDYNEKIA